MYVCYVMLYQKGHQQVPSFTQIKKQWHFAPKAIRKTWIYEWVRKLSCWQTYWQRFFWLKCLLIFIIGRSLIIFFIHLFGLLICFFFIMFSSFWFYNLTFKTKLIELALGWVYVLTASQTSFKLCYVTIPRNNYYIQLNNHY